jgi:nicotinamidase-related amidase
MKNKSNVALLIIDMQNAYFNNEALRECQTDLVEKINSLIAIARQYNLPIFNATTEHQKDIATWTLNMLDDKQGYLFADSDDVKIIDRLDTHDSIDVIKTRDSAFYETPLAIMLKNHGIDTIVLCGVSTHTCIFQTASDGYAANFRIILIEDAIATHQPRYHKDALTILHTEYRQRIMNTSQLKQYVKNNSQQDT